MPDHQKKVVNVDGESITVLSDEQVVELINMIEDRRAVRRMTGKLKNIGLTVAASIAAYIFLYEKGVQWLKHALK